MVNRTYKALAGFDGWHSVTVYQSDGLWFVNAYNTDGRKLEHTPLVTHK